MPRFAIYVGTPHPSPAKAAEFERVDLQSIRATTAAAVNATHLVYVSVAHPAPVMPADSAARKAGEALLQATGIPATVLRPWYVLGSGHRWPYALVPTYAMLRLRPSTREGSHAARARHQKVSSLQPVCAASDGGHGPQRQRPLQFATRSSWRNWLVRAA